MRLPFFGKDFLPYRRQSMTSDVLLDVGRVIAETVTDQIILARNPPYVQKKSPYFSWEYLESVASWSGFSRPSYFLPSMIQVG